jgi:hypothetical protein
MVLPQDPTDDQHVVALFSPPAESDRVAGSKVARVNCGSRSIGFNGDARRNEEHTTACRIEIIADDREHLSEEK